MMTLGPKRIEIVEGTSPVFVARIEDYLTGIALGIGDITSVKVSAYKMQSDTPATAIYESGAIPPANVYYDTLQYGFANLLGDAGGANFKFSIADDDFHFDGGATYRIQIESKISSSKHNQLYDLVVHEVF